MFLLSVVVDDLYVLGTSRRPDEADSPLLVDPDAVLTRSLTPQALESVTGRDPEVLQGLGGIEHDQLAERRAFDAWVESPRVLT